MTIILKHTPGEVEPVIQFFRRESGRLRFLTKVIIGPGKMII